MMSFHYYGKIHTTIDTKDEIYRVFFIWIIKLWTIFSLSIAVVVDLFVDLKPLINTIRIEENIKDQT